MAGQLINKNIDFWCLGKDRTGHCPGSFPILCRPLSLSLSSIFQSQTHQILNENPFNGGFVLLKILEGWDDAHSFYRLHLKDRPTSMKLKGICQVIWPKFIGFLYFAVKQ
ncbi:hypothetical protein Drorol1_Dr00010858 [Drosera rotundifolia]